MNEIVQGVKDSAIVVPERVSILEDFDEAEFEMIAGSALRERALFRVYRMWRENKEEDIVAVLNERGGDYQYFVNVVEDLSKRSGTSKSTIWSRIRVYSQLEWLGYDDQRMFEILNRRPDLTRRVLANIMSWDVRNQEPKKMLTDAFGDVEHDGIKENIKTVLDEIVDHDNPAEALSYLQHDVLGRPEVALAVVDHEFFAVKFTEVGYDNMGNEVRGEERTVILSPEFDLPEEIVEALQKKYKLNTVSLSAYMGAGGEE